MCLEMCLQPSADHIFSSVKKEEKHELMNKTDAIVDLVLC